MNWESEGERTGGIREGRIGQRWMKIDQRNLHWFECDSLMAAGKQA